MTERIGYVGVDHHHRDPYFAIASGLGLDITAVCEPGREIDLANLAAMDERPDEITTEGQEVADLVEGATVYPTPSGSSPRPTSTSSGSPTETTGFRRSSKPRWITAFT